MTTSTLSLDQRVDALWMEHLERDWKKRHQWEFARQLSVLRTMVEEAPSTLWGPPPSTKVQAIVDRLVQEGIWMPEGSVVLRGRIPVTGQASFSDCVGLAAGTLVMGRRHYDLNSEQVQQLRPLARLKATQKAEHMAQRLPDEKRAALKETVQLRDEMAMRDHPTRPADRQDRRDRGGWNAFGTSYIGGSGNPYDSWSPS